MNKLATSKGNVWLIVLLIVAIIVVALLLTKQGDDDADATVDGETTEEVIEGELGDDGAAAGEAMEEEDEDAGDDAAEGDAMEEEAAE